MLIILAFGVIVFSIHYALLDKIIRKSNISFDGLVRKMLIAYAVATGCAMAFYSATWMFLLSLESASAFVSDLVSSIYFIFGVCSFFIPFFLVLKRQLLLVWSSNIFYTSVFFWVGVTLLYVTAIPVLSVLFLEFDEEVFAYIILPFLAIIASLSLIMRKKYGLAWWTIAKRIFLSLFLFSAGVIILMITMVILTEM